LKWSIHLLNISSENLEKLSEIKKNYVKNLFIEHLMLIKVDLTLEGRKKKKETRGR